MLRSLLGKDKAMRGSRLLGVAAVLAAASCDPGPPEKKMAIYGDHGQTIRATVGEEFGVAAADNPTWSPDSRLKLDSTLPPCVTLTGSRFETSDPGNRAPGGGGGTRFWILKAVQPGEGKLTLASQAGGRDRVLTVIVTAGTSR